MSNSQESGPPVPDLGQTWLATTSSTPAAENTPSDSEHTAPPSGRPDIPWIHKVFNISIQAFTGDIKGPSTTAWWKKATKEAQKLFDGKGEEYDQVKLILSRLPTAVIDSATQQEVATLAALKEMLLVLYEEERWINALDEAYNKGTLFKGRDLAMDKWWANHAFDGLGNTTIVAHNLMESLAGIYQHEFADANVELPDVLDTNYLEFTKDLDMFFQTLERIRKRRIRLERLPSSSSRRRSTAEAATAETNRLITELTKKVNDMVELQTKRDTTTAEYRTKTTNQIKALQEKAYGEQRATNRRTQGRPGDSGKA
ncbi:hypothetical protein LPJ58_002808 [Coemansia sp. RSA 1591]|nr:hypothetical protein LPJ58_002808 [Coemansia sp. RSA 1591]KAJ2444392.1 hypothetical protein IWW46_002046 [Coemansia sp. RSA 2440]